MQQEMALMEKEKKKLAANHVSEIQKLEKEIRKLKDSEGMAKEDLAEVSAQARAVCELRDKNGLLKEEADRFRHGMEKLMAENESLRRQIADLLTSN